MSTKQITMELKREQLGGFFPRFNNKYMNDKEKAELFGMTEKEYISLAEECGGYICYYRGSLIFDNKESGEQFLNKLRELI